MTRIASEIFKAYDIRGVVDRTLTAEAVELVGRALGCAVGSMDTCGCMHGQSCSPSRHSMQCCMISPPYRHNRLYK